MFHRHFWWSRKQALKKNGHARLEMRVLKTLACCGLLKAKVGSVLARFKNARTDNMPLNILQSTNLLGVPPPFL